MKKVFLMRGPSGSGKSYKVNQLKQQYPLAIVVSADFFWDNYGQYVFDRKFAGESHIWCHGNFIDALRKNLGPVIVDNTNTTAFEMKKYVITAQKYGYDIEIMESESPWRFDLDELVQRNVHGVPREILQGQLDRYEKDLTVEKILAAEKV